MMTKGGDHLTRRRHSHSIRLRKNLNHLLSLLEIGDTILKYHRQLKAASEDSAMLDLVPTITDALNMQIQVFGETTIKIDDQFQHEYQNALPWGQLRKLRNIISHDYERVDLEIVDMLVYNMPHLINNIDEICASFNV